MKMTMVPAAISGLTLDDSGAVLYQLESGKDFDARDELIREWEFQFDAETGEMLGGSETMDGKTIEYGANWERLSESVSIEAEELERLELTEEDLVGVPLSLQGETATYARVTEFDGGGSETTYFTQDENGKLLILGYSNTHEYTTEDSEGVEQSGTSTNYNDANWNWLGSSWDDYYGSGYNSNVVVDGVRIETLAILSLTPLIATVRALKVTEVLKSQSRVAMSIVLMLKRVRCSEALR